MAPQQQNRTPMLLHVEYEVFGKVHGVNFTKFCREMCDRHGLKGWVKLSRYGTVHVVIQGEQDSVNEIAQWLHMQGSPGSKIENCEVRNWRLIDKLEYRNFSVRF